MAEIRFAGYGGQGIVRSGIIAAKGASIFDDKYATMNQSFGPEARGGACSSQLIISEEKILYPYVEISDILDLSRVSSEAFSASFLVWRMYVSRTFLSMCRDSYVWRSEMAKQYEVNTHQLDLFLRNAEARNSKLDTRIGSSNSPP